MKATGKTRTQRRMEKRQAIILLVLVLVVSLASFTLGVIVGRRGAERDLVQHQQCQPEKVLVAQVPAPLDLPIINQGVVADDDVAVVDLETEEPVLSFYDDLAKKTAPIGSGINLPPEEVASEVAVPPIKLPSQPIVKTEIAPVVVASKPQLETVAKSAEDVAFPQAVVDGSHAVQIGSFGSATDAGALKDKMVKSGYSAFVAEVDLGEKGLWYRVKLGPYASSATAKVAQQLLEKKEKIKGFVSRQ